MVAVEHEKRIAVDGAEESERPGLFGDVAVGFAEGVVGAGREEAVSDSEVDGGISEVEVSPVNDAGEAVLFIDENVADVEIAVDDSGGSGFAEGLFKEGFELFAVGEEVDFFEFGEVVEDFRDEFFGVDATEVVCEGVVFGEEDGGCLVER